MDLKELLGEEIYEQIKGKLGDKKIAVVSDGNWIPKDKFDQINTEKNQYKDQIAVLNTELGKIKDKVKDTEGLQEKLQNLQNEIENKEKEMNALRKLNTIKLEALKLRPKDINDILPHIKDDLVNIGEDGTITGLQEQLNILVENKPYLFEKETPAGTGGSKGNPPKKTTVINKDTIKQMSPQEINENWETISKLMESGEI